MILAKRVGASLFARALVMMALSAGPLFMTAGCATRASTPVVDATALLETYRAQVRAQRTRIETKIRDQTGPETVLYAADLAFNDDAEKRGLKAAFSDWFTQDGVLIGAGALPSFGPAEVAAAYEGSQDWTLRWAPVDARIDGNLGVTWGIAALSLKDDKGQLLARSTRYVTVWKRQPDGSWKVWLDTGTTGPLPKLD
jgi:ketosteroid isomerase-like protein